MITQLSLALFFILVGAIIIALSIIKMWNILELLSEKKNRKKWLILFYLMIFFFLGYLCMIFIVFKGYSDLLILFLGILAFVGATFIFIVVQTGFFTVQNLKEHARVATENAIQFGDNTRLSIEIEERKMEGEKIKKYSDELKKTNKELDQFAYIVSHDLKAPLRAIGNLSEWIEEDLGTNISEDVKKNMQLLRGRVKRMEMLITGVLEYSRAGKQVSVLHEVDINILLSEVIDFLAPPETFTLEIQKNLPVIYADRVKIQQVFSNLMSNAVKYHHAPNGIIKVACEDKGDMDQFSVTDNGTGIDPQYHEKIFEIFQTLESKDRIESTGIGLTIVKKIIEERGGRIWVESQKDAGASFIFLWPKKK